MKAPHGKALRGTWAGSGKRGGGPYLRASMTSDKQATAVKGPDPASVATLLSQAGPPAPRLEHRTSAVPSDLVILLRRFRLPPARCAAWRLGPINSIALFAPTLLRCCAAIRAGRPRAPNHPRKAWSRKAEHEKTISTPTSACQLPRETLFRDCQRCAIAAAVGSWHPHGAASIRAKPSELLDNGSAIACTFVAWRFRLEIRTCDGVGGSSSTETSNLEGRRKPCLKPRLAEPEP